MDKFRGTFINIGRASPFMSPLQIAPMTYPIILNKNEPDNII